jgi:hypothetical protein
MNFSARKRAGHKIKFKFFFFHFLKSERRACGSASEELEAQMKLKEKALGKLGKRLLAARPDSSRG